VPRTPAPPKILEAWFSKRGAWSRKLEARSREREAQSASARCSFQKDPWSQVGPKSFKMSLLSLFCKGFWEGRPGRIFRLKTHRPPSAEATEPSSETAEPSSEAMQPSADTAKPRQKTPKPRPVHGDSTFSSKPRPSPARPIYGDSAASSKPGLHARSPVFHFRSLVRRLRSPAATHQRQGPLKSACGAVLGFGVSMQNPRR